MANLGRKYTCYSCQTKFYDLGKPEPLCPKCGADQREAEEAPVYTTRGRKSAPVVAEPEVEEDDVVPPVTDDDQEEDLVEQEESDDSDDVDEEEE